MATYYRVKCGECFKSVGSYLNDATGTVLVSPCENKDCPSNKKSNKLPKKPTNKRSASLV